ncbi:MAG: hypothetical protein AB8G11_10180 [Saprospiraceae bacterium]
MKYTKRLILSLLLICSINLLFAQNESNNATFPAYFDALLGLSVTSFSNVDFPFGIAAINAGPTINQNFAVGLDYMLGSSGTAHFIKQFSGLGLQGRYVKHRFLGKITFGNILNTSINGDLITLYRYTNTFDFYGRIDVVYRFRKIFAAGISAYSSTLLTYDLYDYNDISNRYDIFAGTSAQYINGIALTLSVQIFPPYFQK